MRKPKIRIKLDTFDKVIEILAIIAVLLLIGLPMYYFAALPENIPTHYGIDGIPDGFGKKIMIWTLPMFGILLYIGMSIINRYPHLYNYPRDITDENAENQYRMATKVNRIVNMLMVYLFAYVAYATIQTALGDQNGLGIYFTPIFLILVVVTIAYFIYKSLTTE